MSKVFHKISPFSLIFLSGTIIHKIIRITSLFAGQLFPAFKCFVTPIVKCIEIIYPNSYFLPYYDIAAIGYLHAVQRYFTEKSLHRYRFSTIAWRSMNSSLNTFRRQEQRRQSHEFSYQAAHPPPDDAFDALRARLLLHDLFLLADEEQTLLVRHRLHGCSLAETARMEGMSVKRVRHRLKALYRAYFAQKETKQKEL